MEQVQEEQKEEKDSCPLDKFLKLLDERPPKMWFIGIPFSLRTKPWKAGPKKDRIRLNRVRSWSIKYNPTLDVPEIYEKIMSYLDHEDPADALNFARALETLGSQENLEGKYLANKLIQWKYTERVSFGLLRVKILKGNHCRHCGKRFQTYKKLNNTITEIPLCWKCMQLRYKLVSKKKAIGLMLEYNATMPMGQIMSILSRPAGPKCCIGEEGHLRFVKYNHQTYYIKKDVLQARENWKRRNVEECLDPMEQTMGREEYEAILE